MTLSSPIAKFKFCGISKMMKNTKKNSGFTLMELMIVVAIVAILSSIAYPSYTKHVQRGKRSEGRSALLDTAAKLERYYSDCNKYGTLAGASNNCTTSTTSIKNTSQTGLYDLSIVVTSNNHQYTLTATPTFTDADCTTLTLTQAGARGATGANTTNCWDK